MGLFNDLVGFSLFDKTLDEVKPITSDVRVLTDKDRLDIEIKAFNELYDIDTLYYDSGKLFLKYGIYYCMRAMDSVMKFSYSQKKLVKDNIIMEYDVHAGSIFIKSCGDYYAYMWRIARADLIAQITKCIDEAQRKVDVVIAFMEEMEQREREKEERKVKAHQDKIRACYLGYKVLGVE